MKQLSGLLRRLGRERGITGLETAIVLIAFVVVSSTFAFAALSTGLFSSDKAKETMTAGLTEAQGTLELKGAVRANATLTDEAAEAVGTGDGATVAFALDNAPVVRGSMTLSVAGSAQTEGTDFSIDYDTGDITFTAAPANLAAITADYSWYSIDSVVFNLANAAGGKPVDVTPGSTLMNYLDADTLQMAIDDFGLTKLGNADADNMLEAGELFEVSVDVSGYALTDGDEFTVLVKPASGAVLQVTRSLPAAISPVMELH